MQRRVLKKLNKDISLLTFGMMRLPLKDDGAIDEEHVFEMVDYAYENGVTHFDTAWFYHNYQSEKLLGKALKKYERSSYTLATKLPLWECKTVDDAKALFHKQLENLQTDYIDYYLVHSLNDDRCKQVVDWNIMEILEGYQKAGKIKHLGFSFHGELAEFPTAVNLYAWDFALIQLNYVDINHQQGLKGYEMLREKEIPTFIMEPLKGGNLAKFSPSIEQIFHSYDENASMAAWALRWVANLDNVVTILSGMSNLAQMKDNIETLSNFKKLTTEELQLIERVHEEILKRKQINCTGCNYCLPCPHGVSIPKAFALYNNYRMYENDEFLKWSYGLIQREQGEPSNCVDCDVCLDLCPQKLAIPSLLKEVDKLVR